MINKNIITSLYDTEDEAQKAITTALKNYWTPIKKEITPDNKIMITFKKMNFIKS